MTNPGLQIKTLLTDPLTIAIGASVFLLLVGELLSPGFAQGSQIVRLLTIAAILGIAGHGDGLFKLDDDQRRHALRVFVLVFRREAFLPSATDPRTFHVRALEEGKFYEERVATDLSNLVFDKIYPLLARSIADGAPNAPLQDVREAALILLYRLLFILYAEDRDLTGGQAPDRLGADQQFGSAEGVKHGLATAPGRRASPDRRGS